MSQPDIRRWWQFWRRSERIDPPTEDERGKQLRWLEEMERIEQEVFPDSRPRSEVVVPCSCPREFGDPPCPIHGSFA